MSTKKLQIVGSLINVDETLTQSGQAADAKATGDAISLVQQNINVVSDLIGNDGTVSDQIASAIVDKSDVGHTHDELYYTEAEIDTKIATIENSISETKEFAESGDAATLEAAQVYTDSTVSQKSQVQLVTSDVSEFLPTLTIHRLTQEEYDQEVANGTIEENAIYLTSDEVIDLSPYATIEQLESKADLEHSHDDVYYTELEIDTLLVDKADVTHNHDSSYDTKGSADSALVSAKEYIDTIASGLASASHTHDGVYYTETEIDEKVDTLNASISSATTDAKSYADTGNTTTLQSANTYTDNAVAQKSLVQIITWEADD